MRAADFFAESLVGIFGLCFGAFLVVAALEGAHITPQMMLRAGVEYTAAQAIIFLFIGQVSLVCGGVMMWIASRTWRGIPT